MASAAPFRPIVRLLSVAFSTLILISPAHAGFEWMPAPTPQGPPVQMPSPLKTTPEAKPPYVPPTARAFQQRAKIQRPDGWGDLLTPAAPGMAPTSASPTKGGMQTLRMNDDNSGHSGDDNNMESDPRTAGMQHKRIASDDAGDFKTTETEAPAPQETSQETNAPQSLTEGFEDPNKVNMSELGNEAKMREMANAQTSGVQMRRMKPLPTHASTQHNAPQKRKPSAVHSNIDTHHYANAVGFGIDLPLAFALGQIIPEGYTYALEQGVNLGAKVSWNGGQPWPKVIQDMIAPLGLNVSIQDNKAFISQSGAPLQLAGSGKSSPKAAPDSSYEPTAKPAPTKTYAARADAPNQSPRRTQPNRMQVTNPLVPDITDAKPAQPDDGIKDPAPITKRTRMNQPLPDHILRQRARTEDQPITLSQHSVQFWQAHKGQNLRDVLIRWSPKANIELDWESTEDYRLAENVLINDTFSNALIEIFTQHLTDARAPEVSFVDTAKDGKVAKLIVKDRKS